MHGLSLDSQLGKFGIGIRIRQSKSDSLLLKQAELPTLSSDWLKEAASAIQPEILTSTEETTLQTDPTMLTIEDLRNVYSSCFLCGVNWLEDHVSLDCAECGGYAMERPCPDCDGRCATVWKRNLAATHENHKAQWDGGCSLSRCQNQQLCKNASLSNKVINITLNGAVDAWKTTL